MRVRTIAAVFDGTRTGEIAKRSVPVENVKVVNVPPVGSSPNATNVRSPSTP